MAALPECPHDAVRTLDEATLPIRKECRSAAVEIDGLFEVACEATALKAVEELRRIIQDASCVLLGG